MEASSAVGCVCWRTAKIAQLCLFAFRWLVMFYVGATLAADFRDYAALSVLRTRYTTRHFARSAGLGPRLSNTDLSLCSSPARFRDALESSLWCGVRGARVAHQVEEGSKKLALLSRSGTASADAKAHWDWLKARIALWGRAGASRRAVPACYPVRAAIAQEVMQSAPEPFWPKTSY